MKDIITKRKLFTTIGLASLLIVGVACGEGFFNINKKVEGKKSPSTPTQMERDGQPSMPGHGTGAAPFQAQESKPFGKDKPPYKFKKDKKGRFLVNWKLFRDYDSKTKKAGDTLKKIIGQDIALKGFMIPLDYEAKLIKEFLFVPYMPSCSHVPPPPENMIINVTVGKKPGIKPSWYPVEVFGKLQYEKNKKEPVDPYMPSGIFSLKSTAIKEVKD